MLSIGKATATMSSGMTYEAVEPRVFSALDLSTSMPVTIICPGTIAVVLSLPMTSPTSVTVSGRTDSGGQSASVTAPVRMRVLMGIFCCETTTLVSTGGGGAARVVLFR